MDIIDWAQDPEYFGVSDERKLGEQTAIGDSPDSVDDETYRRITGRIA